MEDVDEFVGWDIEQSADFQGQFVSIATIDVAETY
jgi:hypothetical protein